MTATLLAFCGAIVTLKEFKMSALIFGAVSSPFIALYLKNKNAKDFESEYPAATNSIIHDHYMNDYIGSEFEFSDAARASNIVTVHKNVSLKCVRGFQTYQTPIASVLVSKDLHCNSNSDVNLPPNNGVGALGIKWNPFSDTLGFRTGHKKFYLSVYEPLGLLMPIVIRGRILIQRIWREGIDWDSPIPTKYVRV